MSEVKQTQEGTPGLKAANTTQTLAPKEFKMTKEEFDAESARLTLESQRLEVQLKMLQYSDLQDQVNDRFAKRQDKSEKARINGATIKSLAHARALNQARCNHRKGGNGAQGLLLGQDDSADYAVLKHKMSNGDWWIHCLRCHKWWTPPIEADFETAAGYQGAKLEYQTALDFPTKNIPSGSVQFEWGGGVGKNYYREQMRHATNI